MMRLLRVSAVVGSLVMVACSSPKIRVQTAPLEAEVLLLGPAGGEKSLGKTPLEISASDFFSQCGADSDSGCRMIVAKKGFVRESFYFSRSLFKKEFDLNVTLLPAVEWVDLEKAEVFTKRLSEASHFTARIQELIAKRDLDSALDVSKQFTSQFSGVAVAWDLLGNVYYLKGNTSQALDSYQKSLQLRPENVATQEMVKALKGAGAR